MEIEKSSVLVNFGHQKAKSRCEFVVRTLYRCVIPPMKMGEMGFAATARLRVSDEPAYTVDVVE